MELQGISDESWAALFEVLGSGRIAVEVINHDRRRCNIGSILASSGQAAG